MNIRFLAAFLGVVLTIYLTGLLHTYHTLRYFQVPAELTDFRFLPTVNQGLDLLYYWLIIPAFALVLLFYYKRRFFIPAFTAIVLFSLMLGLIAAPVRPVSAKLCLSANSSTMQDFQLLLLPTSDYIVCSGNQFKRIKEEEVSSLKINLDRSTK